MLFTKILSVILAFVIVASFGLFPAIFRTNDVTFDDGWQDEDPFENGEETKPNDYIEDILPIYPPENEDIIDPPGTFDPSFPLDPSFPFDPPETTFDPEWTDDTWVNYIEGGILNNPAFDDSDLNKTFDHITLGVATIKNGQLICGDGGDFFLQCWTSYNELSSGSRFMVYLKGTQTPDGFYCVFKFPNDPNVSIDIRPYLNGTDQVFEIDLSDSYGGGMGGAICLAGNGTVALDYLQIVKIA